MPAASELINALNIIKVDGHSPIPLYYQINLDLKEKIRSGKLQPGDLLPPEVDLSKAYGVGRQTIREAISRLVDENLVERFPGRGTFVCDRADRRKFYLDRSFTQQMAEMGMEAHSKVIKASVGVIDAASPAPFHRRMGSPCLNLKRLRFGGQIPIGLQDTTILTESCTGLEAHDFNRESLYHVLSSEYNLPIVEINHVVSAVAATELHVELLQVALGAPLLLVKTTAFLDNGEPIEATTSYYRADRYEFSTTHTLRDNE